MKLFLEKLLKGFDYHSYGEWWCSLAPSYKYNLTALGMGVSAIATGIETVFGMSWLAFLGFLVAMVFELSSGVYASVIVKKEDVSSMKLSRFSFKAACYLVLIGVPYIFYQSFKARDSSLAAGVFEWIHIFFVVNILVENITSILENLATIQGKDKTYWISKIQNKVNGLIK